MNLASFLTIFVTVFLAEVGDKTQLATMLFAADRAASPWAVFAAASLALVCATAVGVLAGQLLGRLISPEVLRYVAGAGFVTIGLWMLVTAGR